MSESKRPEDDALWKIARHAPDVDKPSVSPEELDAYRTGKLSEQEAEEFERRLADDPGARREIANEVSPVEPPAMPEFELERKSWIAAHGAKSIIALAASVLMVIALRGFLPGSGSDGLLPVQASDFQFEVFGAAERRSANSTEPSESAIAYPGTTVRFELRSRDAQSLLKYRAVYLDTAGELQRIAATEESFAGGVILRLSADDLPPEIDQTYSLLVVATGERELPPTLTLDPAGKSGWVSFRAAIELRSRASVLEGESP